MVIFSKGPSEKPILAYLLALDRRQRGIADRGEFFGRKIQAHPVQTSFYRVPQALLREWRWYYPQNCANIGGREAAHLYLRQIFYFVFGFVFLLLARWKIIMMKLTCTVE